MQNYNRNETMNNNDVLNNYCSPCALAYCGQDFSFDKEVEHFFNFILVSFGSFFTKLDTKYEKIYVFLKKIYFFFTT